MAMTSSTLTLPSSLASPREFVQVGAVGGDGDAGGGDGDAEGGGDGEVDGGGDGSGGGDGDGGGGDGGAKHVAQQ